MTVPLKRLALPCLVALFVSGSACQSPSEPPLVDFGSAPVVGKWRPEDPASAATPPPPAATAAGGTLAPALPSGGGPVVPPPAITGAAGQAASPIPMAGGRAPVTPSAGTAALPPLAGANGSMPAAGAAAVGGGARALSFEVLTATQGGRYQPRNIGAIWIADASGKFVKTLQLWARIRQRYLSKYNAARGGTAVDVTASATLTSHQLHRVSWDLKDRAGAPVAPGKYSVQIEVTDKDAAGATAQFDFDTSMGPATLTPAGSSGYSMVKLQLE